MRTPWKMFADLVSGKSSKDETETAPQPSVDEATPAVTDANRNVADADTAHASVEEAAATSCEPEIAPEREPIEDQMIAGDAAPVAETGPADEPATIEEVAVVAASPAPSENSEELPVRRPVVNAPSPAKAKGTAAKRSPQGTAQIAAATTQATVPAPKSVLNEMADRDREIEDLRKSLAEKLKHQNAQLRKLLDRYESR